jgi:hypothetical protein
MTKFFNYKTYSIVLLIVILIFLTIVYAEEHMYVETCNKLNGAVVSNELNLVCIKLDSVIEIPEVPIQPKPTSDNK